MVKRLYTLRSNAYLWWSFFTIWERNRQSKHKNVCKRKSHSGLFEAHFLKIAWEKDIGFSQQHHYKWNSSFVSKTRKISQTMFEFLLFHTKHTKKVFFEGGGLRRGHRKKIKSLLSQSLLVEKDVFLLGYRRNFKEIWKFFQTVSTLQNARTNPINHYSPSPALAVFPFGVKINYLYSLISSLNLSTWLWIE